MSVTFGNLVDAERTVYLQPTGVAETDVANTIAAIAQVQALGGRGLIKMVETGQPLALNQYVHFRNVSLIGAQRSQISLRSNAGITWGTDAAGNAVSMVSGGTALVGGLPAGTNVITIPAGMTLVPGDYVMIRSNDSQNAFVHPHTAGGNTYPLDFFRVNWVTGTGSAGDSAYLDGSALEGLVTTPFITKLSMDQNYRVENIEFIAGTPAPDLTTFAVSVYESARAEFRNIRCNGMPGIVHYSSHSLLFDECVCDTRINLASDSYSFVSGPSSHVTFRRCIAQNGAHGFTTGGAASGANRYGTMRGLRYENCKVQGGGNTRTSAALFDTHPEGCDVVYKNCEVDAGRIPGTNFSLGFHSRSRGSRYLNCIFKGDTQSTAFQTTGADTLIDSCVIDGSFIGVRVEQITQAPTAQNDRCIVINNRFYNCLGAPIIFNGGKGHQAISNRMVNCGGTPTGVPDGTRSMVHIDNTWAFVGGSTITLAGTAVKDRITIRRNEFDKDVNHFAVYTHGLASTHLEMTNNSVRGYGTGQLRNMPHKRWKAATVYNFNDVIRVASGTSVFVSRTSPSGTTGSTEPTAPGIDGASGGVVWAWFDWQASTAYLVNERVRIASGAVLSCSVPGTSSSTMPTGPGADGPNLVWVLQQAHEDVIHIAYSTKNITD